MMSTIAKKPTFKLLLCRDKVEYVAHILELDLVGTGATKKEALEEVCDAASAQIAFAIEHNCLESIFTPAPHRYFKEWQELEQKMVMQILISQRASVKAEKMERCEAREVPVSKLIPSYA